MSVRADLDTPPPQTRMPAFVDPTLRVIGGVVAVWGAAVLGMLGAFLTPLRFGSTLMPVALAFAVCGPPLVMWYGLETTGRKIGALLPGLVWVLVIVPAVDRTTEGDLVLTQQWVAIVYLFLSPIAAAVAGYRLLLPRR